MTYETALAVEDDIYLKNAELYGGVEIRAKVATFRKRCAVRSKELAAQCRDEISLLSGRLEKFRQEKQTAEKQKASLSKKLNKCKKAAAPTKPMLIMTIIPGVILFVIMMIIGIVVSEWILIVVAFAMVFFCMLAGVMADVGRKAKIKKATEEGIVLSEAVENADKQIEMLDEKIAACEEELATLRRREEAFLRLSSK